MNKGQRIFNTLLICFLLFQIGLSQGFELTVSTLKEKYVVGEPVYILVTLKNRTTHEEKCSGFCMGGRLQVVVNDSKQNRLSYQGVNVEYFTTNQDKLEPSDYKQDLIDLSTNYGNYHPKGVYSTYPFCSMLLAGRYTVYAEYELNKVTLKSNTVEVIVENPPENELEAFERLKHIFTKIYVKKSDSTFITVFKEFLNNYPNSVYAPLAHIYLGYSYGRLKDKEKANKTKIEIIKKYSTSGYALEALKTLKMKAEEKINTIAKLQNEISDSRFQKFAKSMQKQLELQNE
jgi:FtsP/CotA-like multicopper oxidase with cupredoxin domain